MDKQTRARTTISAVNMTATGSRLILQPGSKHVYNRNPGHRSFFHVSPDVRPLTHSHCLAMHARHGVRRQSGHGKKEIQFVSESQELQIGEKNYAPTRQSEGGDLTVLPELTTYVNGVGQKLAAVADRKLPYEFVVLNNSVPNAWALPGGKIAFNRGLLTELKNEAELAAVLGHEIVHAAARHGAKAQERGTMMQVGHGRGTDRRSRRRRRSPISPASRWAAPASARR